MIRRLPSTTRLAAIGLLVLAGCFGSLAGEAAPGDDEDDVFDRCFEDRDCVLAGPSCCDCPTYATPAATGWADSCANVECNPPGTDAGVPTAPGACTPLLARCDFGTCVAACAPIACDVTCALGFAMDAAGCLTCACNDMPLQPTCELDSDCVQVPADCCGCARGGTDTAVPRTSADAHNQGLNCPMGGLPCPDVSTCDPLRVPRCRDHQCALVGPSDPPWTEPPAGACGRSDLPLCPAGQVCVLNRSDDAGPLGLGVCEPR